MDIPGHALSGVTDRMTDENEKKVDLMRDDPTGTDDIIRTMDDHQNQQRETSLDNSVSLISNIDELEGIEIGMSFCTLED